MWYMWLVFGCIKKTNNEKAVKKGQWLLVLLLLPAAADAWPKERDICLYAPSMLNCILTEKTFYYVGKLDLWILHKMSDSKENMSTNHRSSLRQRTKSYAVIKGIQPFWHRNFSFICSDHIFYTLYFQLTNKFQSSYPYKPSLLV
jgi:uncharacterized membrane protein